MRKPYANIFAFADFRKFLEEYFRNRSAEDKTFTQAHICRKLGLPNSRSYFGDIVRGQKPITAPKVEMLIRVLELNKEEAQYFRSLVQYNQTTIKAEKDFYFEQLIELNCTPFKFVDKNAYEFYKEWQHSAIRALLDVENFKDDYKSLANKLMPSISSKKVKQSLELLKKLKLIKKNEQGYWKPVDQIINSGSYVKEELVKNYQIECLETAAKMIVSNHSLPQNISTETISISREKYHDIEKKLQKFKSEVRSIVHKDDNPAEVVYQLNIQLYPQSK